MGKKAYIFLVFAILGVLGVAAPVAMQLEKAGILENISVGMELGEPQVHTGFGSSLLNSTEQFKLDVKDAYTNYMPGYADVIVTYNDVLRVINEPLAFLKTSKVTPPSDNNAFSSKPESTGRPPVTSETSSSPGIVTSTPSSEPPATETRIVASVEAEYLKADSYHRHYLINVTDTNGEEYTFLDTAVRLSDAKMKATAAAQAEHVNRFYKSNTDVNFYLYVAKRMQETDYYENIIPDEKSTKPYYDQFLAALDPGITYAEFEIPDVFARYDKVWKTDHHWNEAGSYEGYRQIIEMVREDTPSILPPREPAARLGIEGSRFYGSFARSCAYSSLWDDFYTFDYGIPSHTVSPNYDFHYTVDSLRKNPPTQITKNMYALCYPKLADLTFPENHTGRNLLVIGDSYAQGVAEVLSSNFDNTLIYYFSSYKGLNYNKVIRDNNITDVLILQFSERIIFDLFKDSGFDTIRTGG